MQEIRTSIDPRLKKLALLKGMPLAAAGAVLFLFYGMRGVTPFGPLILLFALLLVAIGLRPYRKLCRLETTPDQLTIEEGQLQFLHRGRLQFALPIEKITRISYHDRIVLHTDKGDLFLSYFNEDAYQKLQARLDDVVELN